MRRVRLWVYSWVLCSLLSVIAANAIQSKVAGALASLGEPQLASLCAAVLSRVDETLATVACGGVGDLGFRN